MSSQGDCLTSSRAAAWAISQKTIGGGFLEPERRRAGWWVQRCVAHCPELRPPTAQGRLRHAGFICSWWTRCPRFLLRFCFCLCGTEPLEAAVQLTHKHTPTDLAPQRFDDSTAQCWGKQIPVGTIWNLLGGISFYVFHRVAGTKTPVACFSVYIIKLWCKLLPFLNIFYTFPFWCIFPLYICLLGITRWHLIYPVMRIFKAC